MPWTDLISNPNTVAVLVPIVAIVVFGVIVVTKLIIKHRERMAMIERGMDPNSRSGPQSLDDRWQP
jgi:hypothetical protein